VRHDETAAAKIPQKLFEQHLRTQVQKVGRFVEDQQIGIVQQQCCQFYACLPPARKRTDRLVEHRVGQLKLPSDLAAPPFGLTAVAPQKTEDRFAFFKRIVLSQIAQPQLAAPYHFAGVEFFVAQKYPAKRTFARTVATDEPNLLIVGQRAASPVEQFLIAVAFESILQL